jgi:hypothetical protein
MDSWVTLFLVTLAPLSPLLLIDITAMILAVVRWKRHPRVSFFAFSAFAILFLAAIVRTFLIAWLPLYLRELRGWSFEQLTPIYTVIGGVSILIGIVADILLLFAIFGGRSRAKRDLGHPENASVESAHIGELASDHRIQAMGPKRSG